MARPAAGPAESLLAVTLSCSLGIPTRSYNLLFFNIVTALAREKNLFLPFVFNMLTALGVCAADGQKVVM